jgi:hypothetical protein
MVLNETINATIDIAKANAYTPSIVSMWIILAISLLSVGLIFKLASGKRGWGDFFGIYFFTILIMGIVATFFVTCPTIISDSVTKLTNFFK